jgi:lipopolysaccharide/colanic/teichoic acid biosynthesis glycosyltransferase
MYRRLGKRAFDIVAALIALWLLWPILVLTALMVRVILGRPILFRQARPGLRGRLFTILKFRTMREAMDENEEPLPDAERLTGLGRLLRSTSLDELPELINVLRGDMSLVGPRPLLVQYLDRYTPEQMRRHDVRPGITGLAQISGRNALSWEDKFSLDLTYVRSYCLSLDVWIMAHTLWKLVRREGISQPGQATVEEFRGREVE